MWIRLKLLFYYFASELSKYNVSVLKLSLGELKSMGFKFIVPFRASRLWKVSNLFYKSKVQPSSRKSVFKRIMNKSSMQLMITTDLRKYLIIQPNDFYSTLRIILFLYRNLGSAFTIWYPVQPKITFCQYLCF